MKIIMWSILIVLAFSAVSFGQHCPFDGFRMVVVHVTDADNKPATNAEITLKEVNNPEADSCSYSKGLLTKSFMRVEDVLNTKLFINSYENIAQKYCADCSFLGDGYYAASLNQAEATCMIDKGKSDFRYRTRKFEILSGDKKFEVDDARIYSMCLGSGKWSRIQAIEISQKT